LVDGPANGRGPRRADEASANASAGDRPPRPTSSTCAFGGPSGPAPGSGRPPP
jgi:hypothetical protein